MLSKMKKIDKTWGIIEDISNGVKLLAKPRTFFGKPYIVDWFYLDPSGCLVTHEKGIEESDVMDTDYFELT